MDSLFWVVDELRGGCDEEGMKLEIGSTLTREFYVGDVFRRNEEIRSNTIEFGIFRRVFFIFIEFPYLGP